LREMGMCIATPRMSSQSRLVGEGKGRVEGERERDFAYSLRMGCLSFHRSPLGNGHEALVAATVMYPEVGQWEPPSAEEADR
jgi:hypothetical protein